MYDRGAPPLFKNYGGGNWPSVLLPNGFNSVDRFGGFGYGIVVVDEAGIVRSINEYEVEDTIDKMFLIGTRDAKDKDEANAIGGYWHNNKCWRHFEEVGISVEDIDQIVADRLRLLDESKVAINDQDWKLDSLLIEEQANTFELTAFFNGGEKIKLKCNKPGEDHGNMSGIVRAHLRTVSDSGVTKIGYAKKGRATIRFEDDGKMLVKGKLRPKAGKGENFAFTIQSHESSLNLGSSELEIKGTEAFLSGELGAKTYQQIKDMIANHPEVKTLTLTNIAGSIDDEVNMHTGRIIREAGLTTKVLADREVSWGGVDLFCAGTNRIVETGARLGVHSWSDGSLDGIDYPRDHPAHQYQLAYFEKMLGKEIGAEFYFFTLQSAPANDIHVMSLDEIKKWKLATE